MQCLSISSHDSLNNSHLTGKGHFLRKVRQLLVWRSSFYWSAIDMCVCVCVCVCVLVTQSSQTLWDPINHSPPGPSVHGILQTSILECVAISFTKGSSQGLNPGIESRLSALWADSLLFEPPKKHCRWILYHLSYQGSPNKSSDTIKKLQEKYL